MAIADKVQQIQSIKVLLNQLKTIDESTYFHCISVSFITEELLKRIPDKWTTEEQEAIIAGALLHDIGKAFVPFHIQGSSQTLDFNRKIIMQTHPNLGYELIKECGFDEITEEIVLLHHERSDGSGYPVFNTDEFPVFNESNIPDYVVLVSYADMLDALITNKPYRAGLSMQDALIQMEKEIDSGKLSYRFKKALIDFIEDNTKQ